MAVTAALIAGGAAVAGAGINAYGLSQSGRGAQQSTNVDAAALAQAQQDAIQARINAAYTSRLGQAGYSDSQGNCLSAMIQAPTHGCLRSVQASSMHRCRTLLIRQA